jgi:hypothetical protein
MPLQYTGSDPDFPSIVRDYNQARQVLGILLQDPATRIKKLTIVIESCELRITSIIGKREHGTEEQKNWVNQNRVQINLEIQYIRGVRQVLRLPPSMLQDMPIPPEPPPMRNNQDQQEYKPPAHIGLKALQMGLFFGGAAMTISGISKVLQGGYTAIKGGQTLFKAAEETAKLTAKEALDVGATRIGTGLLIQSMAIKSPTSPSSRGGGH